MSAPEKRILSLLLLSISILAQALSAKAELLGIERGKDGALVLTSQNCETLQRQSEAIREWRSTIEPDFRPHSARPVCAKRTGGLFELRVGECLPDLPREFHEKALYRSGPNCWGTTMSLHGLFSKPRFMWSEEMLYWLDSPICRKLNPGEEKHPGDIVNMFGPEAFFGDEPVEGVTFREALFPGRYAGFDRHNGFTGFQSLMHSVTYITPELVFGKDSPSREDRFYFHPLELAYARPPQEHEECRENQELIPYLNEKGKPRREFYGGRGCSYFSSVYRCENIRGYLKEKSVLPEDQTVVEETLELQKLQERIFPVVTTAGALVPKNERSQIRERAELSMRRALAELRKVGAVRPASTSGATEYSLKEMLWAWEYFSAVGLIKSLEQAGL